MMSFVYFSSIFTTYCDASEWRQFGIQDPATPVAEGMIHFHNYLMGFLIFIGLFVFWMLFCVIRFFKDTETNTPSVFSHLSALEIVWTMVPAFILLLIAVPSFSLLYSLDEIIDPWMTLKIIGNQWYWSYEYSDSVLGFKYNTNFDSYMITTDGLTKGAFRLLEVDNRVVLPTNTHIRLLVTAADVIHSWSIPAFGIKIDSTPGRLSQTSLFIKREGVYYGQCSEICGVNHGFMPIVVKSVPVREFLLWRMAK